MHTSTFYTALPYAALTLGTAIAGATVAITAGSSAVAVSGIAIAFFGSYAFFGVVTCGTRHASNPKGFQEEIGKYVATAAGMAVTNIVSTIANVILIQTINDCLYPKRRYYS